MAVAQGGEILAAGWRQTIMESNSFLLRIEGGSASQPAWQNPRIALDANNDNVVTAIDALVVINDLNKNFARVLDLYRPPESVDPYTDVNGDGFLSPTDALAIINELNRSSSGESEPSDTNLWSGKVLTSAGPTLEEPAPNQARSVLIRENTELWWKNWPNTLFEGAIQELVSPRIYQPNDQADDHTQRILDAWSFDLSNLVGNLL